MARSDFSGARRRGQLGPWADLSNVAIVEDLVGSREALANLVGINFNSSRLGGRAIRWVDLSLATAKKADLLESRFMWTIAAYAKFDEANFSGADFWQTMFYRCTFVGAVFDRASLRGVTAVDCDFAGATFDDAEFSSADPSGVPSSGECEGFAKRFRLPIDRTAKASPGHTQLEGWFGPCNFSGSTPKPTDIAGIGPESSFR